MSDSELPRFWAAFDSAGLIAGTALKIVLLAGQRPGEVANMRREHIDDGWWTLPGAPIQVGWPGTKNGATHRVWLPAPAQALIAELETAVPARLRRRARRGGQGLDRAMRAICKALGVERTTPHDLRRTHGTMVTALGFGRDAMNRVQNHKEGGISSVYDRHGYAEENKRVMEAVAARIVSLATGGPEASNVVTASFGR